MSTSPETLVIGVDGGGTGCRITLGTQAAGILAEASGGRANARTDLADTVRNITTAIEAAAQKAGKPVSALHSAQVHLGLAGIVTPADAAALSAALPYQNCTVTDDRATAITGALDGADGYLVAIGTGTIIATSQEGNLRFVSGRGFQLSDHGSGAWLGRAALDWTLQCHDGMMPFSAMTRALLMHFQNDPSEMVRFSATAQPGDYASFVPDVLRAATDGDELGCALMAQGSDFIARGLHALGFRPGDLLCLSGGVGPHYAPFLPDALTTNVQPPKHSAAQGAFQMALRALATEGRP
tara:strand:- start:115377 stop:116267 length:891 start_codon:yes stop_codon:yes gene_type:complete